MFAPLQPTVRRCMLVLSLWISHSAIAAPTELMRWLPPLDEIDQAVTVNSSYRQATAQSQVDQARARQLTINPYEWTVNATLQNRRDQAASQNFLEQNVSVQRGFRWPTKANADQQLATALQLTSQLSIAEARHEARRLLLNDWFDALNDLARARRLGDQVKLLTRQVKVASQRYRAGDAPRLEQMTLDNERLQVAVQQQQAQGNAQRKLDRLRYLGITAVPNVNLVEQAPNLSNVRVNEALRARLTDNHELALAQAEIERATLQRSRYRLDRQPDPILGAGVSRERGGQEQVLAVTASLPLPGAYRRAGWQIAEAEVQLAQQRQQQVYQRLRLDNLDQERAFNLANSQWQQLRQSRQALEQQATLMDKAYALGEVTLNDWLLALRRSIEARSLEEAAQIERLRLYSLILLNGHQLWPHEDMPQAAPMSISMNTDLPMTAPVNNAPGSALPSLLPAGRRL